MYYKSIEDNILIAVGTSSVASAPNIEISRAEYDSILDIVRNKPEDTDTIIYKLHADTLEYVAYDRPEEPVPEEPTDPVIDSIISEVASNGY